MTRLFNFIRQLNIIRNWQGQSVAPIVKPNNFSYSVTRKFCVNTLKCWNCGVERKSYDIFCEKCKVIQKPQHTDNYFKVLGINETYDVDVKDLVRRFRELQNQLHPDKYSNRSENEKMISEEYSSIVNRAYSNLLSPIRRGQHLLGLKGESISENENSSRNQTFLMEIMEMNEEVEEAKSPDQLLALNKKNRTIINSIIQDLSVSFKNNDIEAAKKLLIRMKYYNSISKQINGILRERGIVE